jgi:hypothetical protein
MDQIFFYIQFLLIYKNRQLSFIIIFFTLFVLIRYEIYYYFFWHYFVFSMFQLKQPVVFFSAFLLSKQQLKQMIKTDC